MSDSPLKNSTLAQLGQVEKPQPYVYKCRNGKDTVTFPDPGEMDWIEAEEFLAAMGSKKDSEVLREWVTSEEDYERLLAEKWTLREKNSVLQDIFEHYESIFGSPGEGTASES